MKVAKPILSVDKLQDMFGNVIQITRLTCAIGMERHGYRQQPDAASDRPLLS